MEDKKDREVIRFSPIVTLQELHDQFKEFEKKASEGKIVCISDLIGNAEDFYIKNLNKGR
jgi:hypothetical protein